MNIERRKIRYLIPVAGLVLVISVMVMGYFQIRAALRVGDLTGESLKRSLGVSLSQAGQDLFSKERQLFSSILLSRDSFDPDGFIRFRDTLDSWYGGGELSPHIRGIYFKIDEPGGQVYRYFPGDEDIVSVAELPPSLFRVPFRRPGEKGELYLDIDKEILYRLKLPEILSNMGEDYSWRITAEDGNIVSQSGMEGIDFKPEFQFQLGDRFVFMFDDLRELRIFSKNLHNEGEEAHPDFRLNEDESWGTLEIYFSDGPLDKIVSRNIALNLTAGLAALTLILGAFIFLYRLYRISESHRQKEQEFVSTISHELRTPLAVISASGENISRGIIREEKLGDYGRMITRESRRLGEMIEGVLFYSGLQNGSRKMFIGEKIDLKDLFDDIRERYAAKAGDMDINLVFNLPDGLPSVKTGRQAVSMVVDNLILNALLHAYPPGFQTDPQERVVIVGIDLKAEILVVTIEDRGCGIPSRERKKIFKPFVRGDKSRRNQIPGSGLGLNIARRVAELSGGTLTLDSSFPEGPGKNGAGTLFRFVLPVEVFDE